MSGALTRRYVDFRNSDEYKVSRPNFRFEQHEREALATILAQDNMLNLPPMTLVPRVFQHLDSEEYSEAAKSLKAKHPVSWQLRHRKHKRTCGTQGEILVEGQQDACTMGSIFVRIHKWVARSKYEA